MSIHRSGIKHLRCKRYDVSHGSSPFSALEFAARGLHASGVGVDQAIPLGISFLIDELPRGVRIEPGNGPGHALAQGRGGREVRHKALDLGIIQDHGGGLVAEQRALHIGQAGDDEVGSDVNQFRIASQRCPILRRDDDYATINPAP